MNIYNINNVYTSFLINVIHSLSFKNKHVPKWLQTYAHDKYCKSVKEHLHVIVDACIQKVWLECLIPSSHLSFQIFFLFFSFSISSSVHLPILPLLILFWSFFPSLHMCLSPQFISPLSVLATAVNYLLMLSGGDKLFHTSNIPLPSSSSPAGTWNLFFFSSFTDSFPFYFWGQLPIAMVIHWMNDDESWIYCAYIL